MSELLAKYEYRGVQLEAQEAIEAARLNGEGCGLLNMATGLGKTYVAAKDVKKHLESNPDDRVLVLCHNNDILLQAHETFGEVLPDSVTHGHAFAGNLQDQAQVVYASFGTMNSPTLFDGVPLYQMFDAHEFNYRFVDEGHHSPARTHRQVIEYFQPSKSTDFLLGVSATPHRRDGRNVFEIFGPELYTKTLEEALAEGLLTPVIYKTYTDRLREMLENGEPIEGLTLSQLNKEIFVPRRDEEIAEILFDEMADIPNPHAMIFCQSIEHAKSMAKLLPEAVAIHSKLKPDLQRELKAAFKAGEFPVACVVDKFNEGIDLPNVNFVGFLRSTSSWRIWLQQLGRGLRTVEGKEFVKVVDLAADLERIEMILELEDKVRKVKAEQEGQPIEEIEPPFAPEFSQEARDAIAMSRTVRARLIKKQAELTPLPYVEDLSLPFSQGDIRVAAHHYAYSKDLNMPEFIDYHPHEVLMMAKIYESHTGSLDVHQLRDAYQAQFGEKMKISEINQLLDGLRGYGILSHVAFSKGEKGRQLWRLTAHAVDSLRQIEPYKSHYEQAQINLRRTVDELYAKAGGQNDYDASVFLGKEKDNERRIHIRNKKSRVNTGPEFSAENYMSVSVESRRRHYTETDITGQEGLMAINTESFKKRGIHYHLHGWYEVYDDITLFRWWVSYPGGYEKRPIIRMPTPAELDSLTQLLRSYS
ncbi:MAG TPA: DEAD/DEAH box helicase [Candidatus Saccharimonadales bacterium]|nr:DEAD/DEAH box helicase [Candidatus Saccharimonadales bacterium]